MAGDNQYVDPSDLANLSRGGNILQSMGYDPDEVRMNPDLRAQVMQKIAGPMQVAQNSPPPQIPNPRSQNGNNITPATPGGPRLLNRAQPTIPAPPQAPAQPPPDTLPKVPSASVSPSGTAAAPSNSVDVGNARQAVGNLLAPEPAEPDTSAQDAQIASHSVPLNQRDPLYKEGRGGKVARGFEAAARGFLDRGVLGAVAGAADPSAVGATPYGAPNKDYQIDDATRLAQLALAQKQKTDAIDRFKRQADLRKQQDTASSDAAKSSVDLTKLPNETTTATADMMRAQDAGQPKNEQEAISAAYRATDPKEAAKYFAMAKDMHTATMQEKPPRQPGEQPSAGLVEFSTYRHAREKETGKPISSTDVLDFLHKTDPDAPAEVGSIVADAMSAKQKYADNLRPSDKLDDGGPGNYVDKSTSKIVSGQEFQSTIDKLGRSDPNVKLAKKGYMIDETGNVVQLGGDSSSSATPAPPKAGDVRKGYRYNGGDPSDPASWSKVNARGRNR